VLPSGLAEAVEDEEDLARFLTSSRFLVWSSESQELIVKPAAFIPNPKDGQTSVFRHGSHPSESLWRIGNEHVAGSRTLHGVAIVKAKHVRSVSLDIVAHEPPPRHANIVGWPSSQSDPEMAKAEQKKRAALVARQAEVVRR